MADHEWKLSEDGCLNLNVNCNSLTYHPNLNVILVLTKCSEVLVIDVNSGVLLQRSFLSGDHNGKLLGTYIAGYDKILFADSRGVGMRSDYNGVLLLDTILQIPVSKPDDVVKLELLLSEAILLQQTLRTMELPGVENTADVLEELTSKIKEAQAKPKKGIKAQKWNIVCLELPHCALKWVCTGLVTELKRLNRHIPALAIASAVNERLNSLLPAPQDGSPVDKSLMFSEAMRRQTFAKWPHMNYKWALPDQMAQAGFYHQPNSTGCDRAMCFTCVVCLVCWEPTDEPWSEHERHSPSCPFVKGEYTQNVPLSVTYATAPATVTENTVDLVGTTSVSELVPTANSEGHIIIWNCSRQLKKEASISVRNRLNIYCDFVRRREAWSELDVVEIPVTLSSCFTDEAPDAVDGDHQQIQVSAVSVIGRHNPVTASKSPIEEHEEEAVTSIRPALVVGMNIVKKVKRPCVSSLVRAMNDVNQAASSGQPVIDVIKVDEDSTKLESELHLLVYDFHYKLGDDGGGGGCSGGGGGGGSGVGGTNKKLVSGTGTSASRQENNNMYQDIFFSKILYPGALPIMDEISSEVVVGSSHPPDYVQPAPPECLVDGLAFAAATSTPTGVNYPVVPLGVAVPTAGGGTFDTSMAINEGLVDITNFPSTSNGSPPVENKLSDRESKVDTINELPNNLEQNSTVVSQEPVIVQLITIETSDQNMEISGIYPTKDGGHVLVTLKSSDTAEKSGGMLLLYSLTMEGTVVGLKDNPVCIRQLESKNEDIMSLTLLPLSEREERDNRNSNLGIAAIVSIDGKLSLLDIATLQTVSLYDDDSIKFVSATYCNSLERVCAASDKSSLHFFCIHDEDDDEARLQEDNFGGPSCSQDSFPHMSFTSTANRESSESLIVNSPELGLEELRMLYDLTKFENLVPCYSATVPGCWTELMQAQKQRRHPQHLQHADDVHHTRSWRLQNDLTTWDEHVFELTMRRSVCVGHIDLKFSLHSQCPCPPHIEVTLLKQNATGIGRSKNKKFTADVDAAIDFNIAGENAQKKAGAVENPVTSEEYLSAHNAEILCGPINLASCLDLSDQSGTVTFSSPKLFRTRGRTFLIHMKALADPNSTSPTDKDKKARSSSLLSDNSGVFWEEYFGYTSAISPIDRLASNIANKKMEYIGCDWLHEVSITIRKTKQTDLPNERLERCAMLESNTLVEKLVRIVCEAETMRQNIALDILIWIAVIRLGRLRGVRNELITQQIMFIKVIEAHLGQLIQSCFIKGGRSIAHKCVKLFVVCSDGTKNAVTNGIAQFALSLLHALLENLPQISQCWSAGALRWYFSLLSRSIMLDTVGIAAQKALTLLQQVAQHLHARQNPYHLLLQTRFGLYGTPFEAELFDLEPPVPAKFSSVPVTYASIVASEPMWNSGMVTITGSVGTTGTTHPWMGLSAEPLDLRELLTMPGTQPNVDPKSLGAQSRLKGLTANHYMKGLLEVEPLHFTCHSTSDGTKLEKMETGGCGPMMKPFDAPMFETQLNPVQVTTNGPKKVVENDLFYFYEEVVEKEWDDKEDDKGEKMSNWEVDNRWEKIEKVNSTKNKTKAEQQVSDNKWAWNYNYETEDMTSSNKPEEPGTLQWQQLVVTPPQQMLVIERMHSGARRFVVLDLGAPVLLTDLIVPACPELLSLSIDFWTKSEEADAQRLVVAPDIATKTLVMSDIQPPPICRYIKITTIGRYGMSTTKCKIPVGSFYGHILILPGEDYADRPSEMPVQNSQVNFQNHLSVLSALFEDIQCRYSLACSKLQDLLSPLLMSEIPNVAHMHHYFRRTCDIEKPGAPLDQETCKIISAYQECMTYQHQLNIVRSVIRRLGGTLQNPNADGQNALSSACTDKLRVLGENLLDLMYRVYENGCIRRQIPVLLYQSFDQPMCERLFHWLCVGEDTRMQLSACTLLVRMCGLQPWWGDFLVNTLTQLYSSQQVNIFPQDRVFILLVYLGRKSLCGGASRTTIMDSVLKTLLQQLLPLASYQPTPGFLRSHMDLPLIGWLLLFLSQCLDSAVPVQSSAYDQSQHKMKNDKDQGFAGPTSRWDFLQGELSMQRRMGSVSRCNASRNYRRKLQKKLMHHKQQLEDLEVAKKAFQASTKALSALSSQAAKLSYKLGTALKQQEIFFKKSFRHSSPKLFKELNDSFVVRNENSVEDAGEGSSSSVSTSSSNKQRVTPKDSDNNILCLPHSHCLPVARALITLILHMDFTCNLDMFLLACKVVARVAVWTRPALSLGEIMSEEQLLHLLRVAVWNEQKKTAWGSPWACHAITCLIQDILDGVRNKSSSLSVPNNVEPGPEPDVITEDDSVSNTIITEQEEEVSTAADDSLSAGPSTTGKQSSSFPLPSLLESDDSELEDLLDDILERGRLLMKKAPVNRIPVGIASSVSTALDSRLEYGVEGNVEVTLRCMTAQSAYNLPLSVSAPIAAPPEASRHTLSSHWEENLTEPWQAPRLNQDVLSSVDMLKECFEKLFMQLQAQTSFSNLELVLQLWLTLNLESTGGNSAESMRGFDASVVPTVALSPVAVSSLMSLLAWKAGITVRGWCLAFQTLTLAANLPTEPPDELCSTDQQLTSSIQGMARFIVNDPHFVPLLHSFLSSSRIKGYAGVSVCQCLHEFLVRLEMRCDVVSGSSGLGRTLKDLLLKLVYQLVQPGGAFALQQGPLDAQAKLIQLMLHLNFSNTNVSTAISVLESVGQLAEAYMLSGENIRWHSVLEPGASTGSSFSGFFSVGGVPSNGGTAAPADTKQPSPVSWDNLLISVLRLVINLVQTPLEGFLPVDPLQGSTSQTDEHKAANSRADSVKLPCVADIVLQHEPTMLCLLRALGMSSNSNLALLLLVPDCVPVADHGEPTSVGEAIFQLLSALACKSTSSKFILKPLFTYLSTSHGGLSEPLLSLILQVLDGDGNTDALKEFTAMGGLNVVCTNLVHSNSHLINCYPSTVSVVMQHFSNSHGLPRPQSPASKKGNGSVELYRGLLNFAPLGSINSSNPTAQPADVLIQSAPPHRRARAPAWSYHFYPDETWVELTITLPCAVLLKEVHLQPHLTSLATCPSGVAVEISRDGRSALVPVSPPVDTSGLTFIRLQLPQPEVVTTVLLRLYKPRDSSNIGLSQIRLLGCTTFGDTSNFNIENVSTDDHVIQSSFGWLRLLHHCISVAGEAESELKQNVVTAAAEVDGLLSACCSLLLIPASSLIMPCLERVLYTLGLHDSQLGLQMIDTLLNNGAVPFHQGGMSNAINSVVELLFLLCTTQDLATQSRVSALLTWLRNSAATALQSPQAPLPPAAYVHCAAAVLWAGHENNISYDLSDIVTQDLFNMLYQWTLKLHSRSALKRAVDTVLCSMCYIKPVLFPILLQSMGVLVPIRATGPAASISDDRKDPEATSLTDDSKEQELEDCAEWYDRLVLQDLENLVLSESQLMTIAMTCQSAPATLQLLDSGLPSLLTQAILEFCTTKQNSETKKNGKQVPSSSRMTDADKASGRNHVIPSAKDRKPMVQLETMPMILQFFAEVCSEGLMRDWLGSPEGSVFWPFLLTMLCNKPVDNTRCELINESMATLESAVVKFLSRCCWCHPNNQKLLAKVLCNIITNQKSSQKGEHGISGVTRRLILQLLLESEKLVVCVRGPGPLNNQRAPTIGTKNPAHPSYGVGHATQLLYVSVHSTLAEILKLIGTPNSVGQIVESKSAESGVSKEGQRESVWWEVNEQISVAAGVTAKDKRSKDAKNSAMSIVRSPYGKKTRIASHSSDVQSSCMFQTGQYALQHSALPGIFLPPALTLSQLLTIVQDRDYSLSTPCIKLILTPIPNNNNKETNGTTDESESLMSSASLPTPLQVFTQQGGLALLAQHLPLVYPETLLYFTSAERTISAAYVPQADQVDAEWVKVEASDDIYEDVDETILNVGVTGPGPSSSGRHTENGASITAPSVPLHSLAAFGLFLRLPGYAEVLLKDKRKAQCLLRLVLGVTDDGEGGDILSCPVASSLPTLPFEILRQLLESTPLSTDDGVFLRRTALEVGALHLLLACLAVFTHQPQDLTLPGIQHQLVVAATKPQNNENRSKSDDKSHLYWAKGTGFGTGSTTQSWNVEQALSRQRSEEEHVTVLLQVLSSYINPGGLLPCGFLTDEDSDSLDTQTESPLQPLPPCIHDLLQQSCLLPALSSYLRNDSVLDMARHIPLYRSVLQLLRAMAQNSQLVTLLLPSHRLKGGKQSGSSSSSDQLSVVCLLTKMKSCVDTYASRLKINKPKGHRKSSRSANNKTQEELESDEGLALLIPDIQETANLVQMATDRLVYDTESEGEGGMHGSPDHPLRKTLEERYLEVMKALQFDTYEMITESSDGSGFQFVVSYHFESNVRAGGDRSHPTRVKRLAQETVTLSTSLPLSYSSSVFVRCDADRLDIMKVLITGPAETPYANGCFELDVYFPPDYPNSPMLINLETTGHHTIRFNPNLYNDGKVCLSVLNTWHGRPEEKWNAHTSSFLQVLVSIQSLILVPEPYFNEPGYERSRGTPAGNQSSREYNSNICQATVKWAMLEQLRNPSPCFRQVIQTHFWLKRKEIKNQIEGWVADMESQAADRRTGRTISLNTMALKRHFQQLCEELKKLKPPAGLEDLVDDTDFEMESSSSSSKSQANTTSSQPNTWQERDKDMEKMVSQVCE